MNVPRPLPFLVALTAPIVAAQIPVVSPNAQPAPKSALTVDYSKLALSFEVNRGQTNSQVKYTSRGDGFSLFLTDSAAVLTLTKTNDPKGDPASQNRFDRLPASGKNSPSFDKTIHSLEQDRSTSDGKGVRKPEKAPITDVVRMELAGASRNLSVEGAEQLPGTANYFLGNDRAKWRTDVPTYAKVKCSGVYPGVDLVYYGNQRQLEYDFVVAPGASANPIRLRFAGATKLEITPSGDLTVGAANGSIAFHNPVVYQEIGGRRHAVDGRFALLANRTVGFALGSYNHAAPLVIDPVLVYSTYLGGSGIYGTSFGDQPVAMTVDSSGDTYIAGYTYSTNFPVTSGAYQSESKATTNQTRTGFVTKLNAAGSALLYSTYLGGSGLSGSSGYVDQYGDVVGGIAVDASGNAYVNGYTYSTDFPVTPNAYGASNKTNGQSTGFVAKLNPAGTGLTYSTYLGGSTQDSANAIAVDSSGSAYVAGTTASSDFPVTQGAFQTTFTGGGAFITKLNPTGTGLTYSTLLGEGTQANAIALDASGDAYVGGLTYSVFPVTPGAFQTADPGSGYGSYVGFVTKLNTTGSALVYSTFLGGSGYGENTNYGDQVYAIAVDSYGDAYVVGNADSPDFPVTPGAFQMTNAVYAAGYIGTAFASKLNSTGTALLYSTYLGGSLPTYGYRIAVDGSGEAYVAGSTLATDFPVTPGNISSTLPDGCGDSGAFVSRLNPTGTALLYSTYLDHYVVMPEECANFSSEATGIATDGSGNVYLTGVTTNIDFPITSGAFQPVTPSPIYATNSNGQTYLESSGNVGFVSKLALGAPTPFTATTTSISASVNPETVGANVSFTAYVQPGSRSGIPTGAVTFLIDGAPSKVTLDDTGHAAYSPAGLGVGEHTVEAIYSGDTSYSTSNASLTETIVPVTTVTTLSSSVNPSLLGQAVTFTATVTAASGSTPTGNVVFSHSGTAYATAALSNGVATYTTSTLTAATGHPVVATYTGNATDASSVSKQVTQAVLIPTTTALVSSANPALLGQSITFTATVAASSGATPTGNVVFSHSGTAYATVALSNGVATYTTSTLTAATGHPILATYLGAGVDASSVSKQITQAVLIPTTTKLTSSLNPSTSGQSVTLTATVAATSGATPAGTVTFFNGTTKLGTGTLSNGRATLTTTTLPTGTLSLTASYPTTGVDDASTSTALKQTVNP